MGELYQKIPEDTMVELQAITTTAGGTVFTEAAVEEFKPRIEIPQGEYSRKSADTLKERYTLP